MGRAAKRAREREEARKAKKKKLKPGEVTLFEPRWFSDSKAVYDHSASSRVTYATVVRAISKEVRALARTLDRSNVLEIGVGNFPFSATISPNRVTLLDISRKQLEFAEQELKLLKMQSHAYPSSRNVKFVEADARRGLPRELFGEHFSAIVMNEILTHVRPEERGAFLEIWAQHTDSIMLIDRHSKNPKKLKQRPDFMNGFAIRDKLIALGFDIEHFETRLLQMRGEKESLNDWFFLLTAKKH